MGTIYEFNSANYGRNDIDNFSEELCEHLAEIDEENIRKFELGVGANPNPIKTMQNLLNDDALDTTNCFYRIFIHNNED